MATTNIIDIPCGTPIPNKRNGAFIAITASCQLYLNYEDPSMTEEYRSRWFPVVLMVNRWDGKLGFPGGFVDDGETIIEATVRELIEETKISLRKDDVITPLCAHETPWIAVHLHWIDLGKLSVGNLQAIIAKAVTAEHSVVEGSPVWIHLADYGRNKGLNTTLNNNTLATAVKEELEILLSKMAEKK